MLRKAVSVVAGLSILVFLVHAKERKTQDPAFAQIDSIVKSLSEITGFTEKHAVPSGSMSKRQLRAFLNKRIKKTLKPDEIYADELSLKLFGLVPPDFDLKRSTIDLLTEQAAAFYDYDERKLFMLEGASFAAETTTLAHELSHALADQYFDLNKFMEESPANDDENLAHTAVVEGQASWLMIAWELKQNGQPASPTPDMIKNVADSSEASMADYPVLKGSPLYIQQSLLFPYAEGTAFFDAVFKKMGKAAFAAVFTDPPVDSSQIMHPQLYFDHVKPAKPVLPKVHLTDKAKEISEGTVGEFDHSIMLRQYLGEKPASAFSGHLRGGQFEVLAHGKAKRPMLLYASEWDSNEEATSFFLAYQKVLRGKWKHCDATVDNTYLFKGSGDNGFFLARLEGKVVTSVEGAESESELPEEKPPQSTEIHSSMERRKEK